jgi:hypothetical protein
VQSLSEQKEIQSKTNEQIAQLVQALLAKNWHLILELQLKVTSVT